MQEQSVLDIIGPVMVGPSSSHTAGAARLGYLAGRLCGGRVVQAEFILYGSFARTGDGHGTPRALLGGVLGLSPEDERIRDAFELARERGVEFSFRKDTQTAGLHPNTADILLTDAAGKTRRVRGKSVGGGRVVIENIDGVQVDVTGDYPTVVVEQRDAPGVVAAITRALSLRGINIAFMRLYRESKGHRAYTVIEADEPIPPEVAKDLMAHPDIEEALLLEVGA